MRSHKGEQRDFRKGAIEAHDVLLPGKLRDASPRNAVQGWWIVPGVLLGAILWAVACWLFVGWLFE